MFSSLTVILMTCHTSTGLVAGGGEHGAGCPRELRFCAILSPSLYSLSDCTFFSIRQSSLLLCVDKIPIFILMKPFSVFEHSAVFQGDRAVGINIALTSLETSQRAETAQAEPHCSGCVVVQSKL